MLPDRYLAPLWLLRTPTSHHWPICSPFGTSRVQSTVWKQSLPFSFLDSAMFSINDDFGEYAILCIIYMLKYLPDHLSSLRFSHLVIHTRIASHYQSNCFSPYTLSFQHFSHIDFASSIETLPIVYAFAPFVLFISDTSVLQTQPVVVPKHSQLKQPSCCFVTPHSIDSEVFEHNPHPHRTC